MALHMHSISMRQRFDYKSIKNTQFKNKIQNHQEANILKATIIILVKAN